MKITLAPGTYVVAVSGGVDSVALLDMLAGQPGVKLVVAHFDHGIRDESRVDRQFVQALAARYGVTFIYDEGKLGARASEATARAARYNFLRRVRQASGARAIITAHHHDDVLETAIVNLVRGTGRKGLSSLQSTADVYRPFIHIPKQLLVEYAKARGLEWREDATNADTRYLRNHVRHRVLPRFAAEHRQRLRALIDQAHATNHELDVLLINQLHTQPSRTELDRHWFIMLPHAVAREMLAAWLRSHDMRDFDRRHIERIVVRAKTLASGKRIDLNRAHQLHVTKTTLALVPRGR